MSAPADVWSILPLPAFIVDRAERIAGANPAAEGYLSQSSGTLSRRALAEVFGPDSRAEGLTRRARESGVTVSDHNLRFTPVRRPADVVDLYATPSDADGEVLLIVQPRSLAETIDRKLTHRSAARSFSGMGAMLAHEIKNPLAGISGAAQLLELSVDEDGRDLTTLIREEAERIGALVSRVESFGDHGPPRRAPVNIHDVFHRAKRAAEAGFARHVRFREIYDPSLPAVPGDADQLMQVAQNLLKNAAEAAPPVGGIITLRSAYQPGVAMTGPGGSRVAAPLMFSVSDNGPGVPEDMVEDIFEPFVSSKSGGGGLGLALVAKIVADHGGAIDCASREGWTEFRLRLPIWRDARERERA